MYYTIFLLYCQSDFLKFTCKTLFLPRAAPYTNQNMGIFTNLFPPGGNRAGGSTLFPYIFLGFFLLFSECFAIITLYYFDVPPGPPAGTEEGET